MSTDSSQVVGAIACLAVSVSAVVFLWTRRPGDCVLKKVLWTLILFIPFAGWVCCAAFYNPPSVQSEELQGKWSGRGRGAILLSIKGRRLDDRGP